MHGKTGAIQIDWHDAPERISSMLQTGEDPAVVCISGPVGSGKSTLAARLVRSVEHAALIATDDYLPDYASVPEAQRDLPGRAQLDELAGHVGLLKSGHPATVPVWSFKSHSRVGNRKIEPATLIVVEGIHALHRKLDAVRSLGVLVTASPRLRWARWEVLESSGQRGWGVDRARRFFETVADPTFDRFRPHYLSRADIIVTNDDGIPDPFKAPEPRIPR
ncbi:MAG: hypothetical protein AAGA55_11355 [Planctomycetota bacterium]